MLVYRSQNIYLFSQEVATGRHSPAGVPEGFCHHGQGRDAQRVLDGRPSSANVGWGIFPQVEDTMNLQGHI